MASEIEQENVPNSPHAIHSNGDESEIFALDTHPSRDLLVTGDITGRVNLYSYAPAEDCTVMRSIHAHSAGCSCRNLRFSSAGKRFFSGSGGRGELCCVDTETGKTLHHNKKAHRGPLYSLHVLSEGVLATGDEKGEIKLWDTRNWRETFKLKENTDFISSLATDEERRTLLATSGDGSLTAVDLRQRRLEQRSDSNESELLSLAIVKAGKKVVCGDGEGALMIYNWGLWGDITDRFPAHPQSIDCMLALNDSVVCTGCMDGSVRSVQILPNQILSAFGQHTDGLPVDNVCLTHNRQFLVTSSQDSCKFWCVEDIPMLPQTTAEQAKTSGRKRKRKQRTDEEDLSSQDFFADLCS